MESFQVKEKVEDSVPHEMPKRPKWGTVLFRMYAIGMLLTVLLSGIGLATSSFFGKDFLEVLRSPYSSILGIIAIGFGIVAVIIIVFEVIYVVGIFKNRRWVLPLVFFFAFYTILNGTIFLILHDTGKTTSEIFNVTFLIIKMIFMAGLVYVSKKYWGTFEGSARKLCYQIPIVLFLLPFLLFATVNILFVDEKEVRDTDLQLPEIALVSTDDNAYYLLLISDDSSKTILQDAREYARRYLDGEVSDFNQLLVHFSRNVDALQMFRKASKAHVYQCPSTLNEYGIDVIGCSLSGIPDMATLTASQAKAEAQQGMVEESIETSLTILRVANLFANAEKPEMTHYLTGIRLLRIGFDSLSESLTYVTATTSQSVLQNAYDEIQQYELDGSTLSSVFKREYLMMREIIEPFEEYRSYVYHPNRTANMYANYLRAQIDITTTACGEEYETKYETISAYLEENSYRYDVSFSLIISPNSIGKILHGVNATSLLSVRGRECEINEINRSIQEKILSLLS